jgi:putative ATPase
MPECNVVLAQVAAYLARAPKSTAVYAAYESIKKLVSTEENPPVPLHLRNAPTKLMKEMGYSKGYLYNPDYEKNAEVLKKQKYLPESLKDKKFFVMKENKSIQ